VIFAFRHGPTVASAGAVGQLDVPLAGTAEAAAEAIVAQLDSPIHRVHSSPLRRCADTARLVAARLDLPHTIDPRLLEIHLGEFQGRAWDELRGHPGHDAYMRAWETEGPPGGESAHQVSARVAAWLDELAHAENHLLVAHAGVVRALRVLRLEQSWPVAMGSPVDHLILYRFSHNRHRSDPWPR
jgi:alpha-ribazole phosphatase